MKKRKQLKHKDLKRIRKKLLRKQDGICEICKKPPVRPCVDHEHVKKLKGSGLIRGVLCSSCNVFLAKMENNCIRYGIKLKDLPSILKNVIKYIKKEPTRYIHPTEKPKEKKLQKASFKKFQKLYLKEKGRIPKKLTKYPRSGKLTKALKEAYEKINLKPEFYK